ncbi:uncharacterized protein LOC143254898 [Tachypleus tridentatus]|uniref:uncharacterized protein LOC143254898 n=1 Tax=Tachypleus tridentatus TaxID=6853 RepID=UPI003FD43EE7
MTTDFYQREKYSKVFAGLNLRWHSLGRNSCACKIKRVALPNYVHFFSSSTQETALFYKLLSVVGSVLEELLLKDYFVLVGGEGMTASQFFFMFYCGEIHSPWDLVLEPAVNYEPPDSHFVHFNHLITPDLIFLGFSQLKC